MESGLQAFEKEGVQKVTTLKDDLVKAEHAQSPEIVKRNDELVERFFLTFSVYMTFIQYSRLQRFSSFLS